MRRLGDVDETGREEGEGSEEGAQREAAREPRALLHVPVPVQQPRRMRRRRHEQHRVLRGVGAGVGLLRCPIVRLTRRDRRHVREHLWRSFRRQSRVHRRTRRPRRGAPAVVAARREINADIKSRASRQYEKGRRLRATHAVPTRYTRGTHARALQRMNSAKLYSPPPARLREASGGRDFVYADSPGEASLKPTTRPIS